MATKYRKYEGLISIAVTIKAKSVAEALKMLDENPLQFTYPRISAIEITSETHEVSSARRNNA